MNTGRKLSLGFGALLLILLLTALVVMGRLDRLEQQLRQITAFAEPASAAAYEMEIGVAGIDLTVLRYLHTPSAELRERMASQQRDFEESSSRHARLAKASPGEATSERIGRLFLEHAATGSALMDGADRRRRLAMELGRGFERAGQALVGELRAGIDPKGRAASRKLEVVNQIAFDLAEVGDWLGHYTRTLEPAHRARLAAASGELGAELARFEALGLTAAERSLAEQARRSLGDLVARARELAELEQAERQRMGRFLDLRGELDAALRGETQLMAERDLLTAKDSTHHSLRVIRSTVFLLLAGGLLVGGATSLAFGRGIVRAEAELKAERERLRVVEQDLQQRTRDLEDADRRKDEFLAMLGHELRNPLAPVRNGLEILKSETLEPRAKEECRAMMERQVRHLTRLTDDLLDVSRITRGRIELRRERLDLRELVTSGLAGIAPVRDLRLHGVSASLCAEPVPVDGDPLRLGQVLANLVNNAMQYRTGAGAIHVSVALEPGTALLTVRDHGIGLDAAMLPRIFEPFVQVDSSLARSRGGLGIGLALVKSLVELHGGTVGAASDGPGRGSEFSVRLPLAAAAATTAAAPAYEARAGWPRRVLVVEDNRDSAESLAMLLTLAGHEVRVAYDGASAIADARSYLPQVILLDIGLPRMDGFEAARRLRGEPGLDGALLVAMTGYGQAEDRERSKAAGFDRHLTKPVEPDVLYELLRELDGVKDPLGTD